MAVTRRGAAAASSGSDGEARKRASRGGAGGPEDEAGEDGAGSLEFNEWQLAWYRAVLRKTAVWAVAFVGLFAAGVVYGGVDEAHPPAFEEHDRARVALTAAGAVLSWTTLYFDLYRATPPAKEDMKKHLMEKNFNGHFSYLTFYILFSFLVYWNACLLAELGWMHGHAHHEEHLWVRKLLRVLYASAPVVGGMGVTLAVLFMKFNWYEPNWRREVLELYHARGHTTFGPTLLFTHLNQTPLSILDVVFIKHRGLMSVATPDFALVTVFFLVFGSFFVWSTHVNHSLSGGHYPYPFLRKILGTTWALELGFVGGIIVFFNFMSYAMHFMAGFAGSLFLP